MIEFGVSQSDFRYTYFEQKPHHFRGALTDRPFTWSSIDRLLHILDPVASTIRMFHHGQLPEHAYCDEFVEIGKPRRRLNKPKFYELLKGGATLQINSMLGYNPLVAESATIRLDMPAAPTTEVINAILISLSAIERDRPTNQGLPI